MQPKAEIETPILTADMAKDVHATLSQVNVPMGKALQALQLLGAVAAIANGHTKVTPAQEPRMIKAASDKSPT